MSNSTDLRNGARATLTFAAADPEAVDLLGGKGAGLARMHQQGIRVPPGFVVTTDACRSYLATGALPDGLTDELFEQLAAVEEATSKQFGSGPTPLLLSIRSGAPVSMPGMMDTVLNLGLGRAAAIAIAQVTDDSRFMADLLARFHSMYSEIVLGALDEPAGISELVAQVEPGDDPATVYDRVWTACQTALDGELGEQVPDDPRRQLLGAVEAVFRSWNNRRANTYREFHKIPHTLGTAVVVQSMVFGNLSADSGSGVVFTRDPATGEPGLFGEYLAHSQGEDVVAGVRTPDPVRTALPAPLLTELELTCADLERRHGDVLDIEFTVERSILYFLQVRAAKRTAEAAVRFAADFIAEGTATPAVALSHLTPDHVRQVQRPGFDTGEVDAARAQGRVLTTGIGACPGQVSGVLVLDSDRAQELARAGRAVILARPVTSPADLHGMIAAAGIVTATGGATSHAAVVARALGRTCVVGAGELLVDQQARTAAVGDRVVSEGDTVSLDGASGELFLGEFATATPAAANGPLSTLLTFGRAAGCEVFGRVTLPGDVEPALAAGATGLVTAIDDVLAATGHLDRIVDTLLAQRNQDHPRFESIADAVAAEFAPLFAAAGTTEIGVRAIDFVADEARELLQQTALTTQYPQLAVPLGLPGLVEAQIAGITRAIAAAGTTATVHLAVRHVSDPLEAAALRTLQTNGADLPVGTYLTSPRAAANFPGIAESSDVLWLEVRVLQAALFGLPARQLLTAQPLDNYLARGLLGTDPRTSVDAALDSMLTGIAARTADFPACPVGMRISGAVSQEVVNRLYEHGFRRFAVDGDEIRPALLALGKAALAR